MSYKSALFSICGLLFLLLLASCPVGDWLNQGPAEPVLLPDGGLYEGSISIQAEAQQDQTTIHFLVTDEAPSGLSRLDEVGSLWEGDLLLRRNAYVSVQASRNGLYSKVLTRRYYVQPLRPTMEGYHCGLDGITTFTLQPAEADDVVHYALLSNILDESIPDANSPVATGVITITTPTMVRAISLRDGCEPSYMFNCLIDSEGQVATPSLNPPGGYYSNEEAISISMVCDTEGAEIRYTIDGSTPTATSPLYTEPFPIDSTMTISAIGIREGVTDSSVAQATYTFCVLSVENPVVSYEKLPDGQPWSESLRMTISCATPGSSIRYTTDGSNPTIDTGILYEGPFLTPPEVSIRAISFVAGSPFTGWCSDSFNIQIKVATPAFSPPGGWYSSAQSLSLTCETPGSIIRYTLDGSFPFEANSVIYTGPIAITQSTIVWAFASREGDFVSDRISSSYIFPGTVEAPVLSPSGGQYLNSVAVTMTSPTANAYLHFTTDGTDPTLSSPGAYNGVTLTISEDTTLKVVATVDSFMSEPVTAQYSIRKKAGNPSFSVVGGSYSSTQSVSLSCSTPDATIRYTIDGSLPSGTNGLIYSAPVAVDRSRTIRAIAYAAGMEDSDVVAETYTLYVADPYFTNFSPGEFINSCEVRLAAPTEGASFRYTMDGSVPSPLYGTVLEAGASITLEQSTTIKAIAYIDGWTSSAVIQGEYILKASHPYSVLSGGTYYTELSVPLMTTTENASISYTTDGSEPTPTHGTVIPSGSTATVNASRTLKAVAFKEGAVASSVTSIEFILKVSALSVDPPGASYQGPQSVTLSTTSPLASISYTLDGSEPSSTHGTVMGNPATVLIEEGASLRAVGFRAGWSDSALVSELYSIESYAPAFSHAAGAYTSPFSLSMSTSASGGIIRYTTDGSDPTAASPSYLSPVTIDRNMTVKARTFVVGQLPSAAASAAFTFTVAEPVFSLPSGYCDGPQTVAIESSTPGSSISYTTDGSMPSRTNGTIIASGGTLSVPVSMTIWAMAFREDWDDSTRTYAIYTITAKAGQPVFSLAGGTYVGTQTVTITAEQAGDYISYTTNGEDPPESGLYQLGPITVTVSSRTTLKAVSARYGWINSDVTSAEYVITGTVSDPSLYPGPGFYSEAQSVSMYHPNADIHYTIDGTEPTLESPSYTGSIAVTATMTIRARAFREDWTPSAEVGGLYTITGPVSTPVISPVGGASYGDLEVSISCATPGASIRYTVDGSNPEADHGTLYGGPFTLTAGDAYLVCAVAYFSADAISEVAINYYTLYAETVANPQASLEAGTYKGPQEVALSCSTPGASIRYTVDGTLAWSDRGILYTGPITISDGCTLFGMAYTDLYTISDMGLMKVYHIVNPPLISLAPGTYQGTQSVSLAVNGKDGEAIYYTTDGSLPTTASSLYAEPIEVSASLTLRAVTSYGGVVSDPSEAAYVIE